MERERWREVEDLFQAALERKPQDRAAFLSRACAEDVALREEVESLLTADEGASGAHGRDPPVARLIDGLRDQLASAPMAHEVAPRLQTALGAEFRIERELPRGGMSRVFVAEETSLGRRVVIKVLAPRIGAELDVERFHHEIRIAAGLQHPHILPVHSAGEGGGLLYYTMPFVEGESLRHRIDRLGGLALPEAVKLLREITDALAYAHRRGIVHRDLKPANILVNEGHALIIDFGIAKALSAAAVPCS